MIPLPWQQGRRPRSKEAQTHPLSVLQSFTAPKPTSNPYLSELLGSLPTGFHVDTFSWWNALAGDYDVLHLHWPELLMRKRTPGRSAVAQCLFALLLARCRLRRTAVVRTLHNAAPHEAGSRREGWLLRVCERRTTWWISLNGTDNLAPSTPASTILHGHYRDWYQGVTVPSRVVDRLAFVGLIREYKSVDRLLVAFRELEDEGVTLTVAGKPQTDALRRSLSGTVKADPRVTAVFDYLGEAELARHVGEAQIVVLPYRELGNSGAALLALSLGRPVLVPSNPTTRALAEEVGREWVRLYDGPLDAADLRSALTATRTLSVQDQPDLSARSWERIGREHAEVYRCALRVARAGSVPCEEASL